jgi:hypothetical protein
MKTKVIQFFQNLPEAPHEQFNQAFALYRESDGKSQAAERAINAVGYTPGALNNLLYDLQKLHGVTDVEKIKVESQKAKVKSEEEIEKEKWDSLDPEIASLFYTFLAVYPEHIDRWAIDRHEQFGDVEELLEIASTACITEVSAKLQACVDYLKSPMPLVKEGVLQLNPNSEVTGTQEELAPGIVIGEGVLLSTEGVPVSTEAGLLEENETLKSENENLQDENEDLKTVLRQAQDDNETLKLAPKLDAKAVRIEFPFLNDKDCPDEMKILVADKITAWNAYLMLQEAIARVEAGEAEATPKRLAEYAQEAVLLFDENQKIYDELNAYQTTGKILGLHPIFKKLQFTREVEEMTADELIKYKGSSAKYFSVKKTALAKAKKAKDEAKVTEIESALAERHDKLFLVNKKLGV